MATAVAASGPAPPAATSPTARAASAGPPPARPPSSTAAEANPPTLTAKEGPNHMAHHHMGLGRQMSLSCSNGQHYSLRWNNHQAHVLTAFEALLQSEALVDCTLICEDTSLRAHKVVLAACR